MNQCSIGHLPSHDLPTKLAAISSAGFEAIELSMPDILSYGKQISGKDIDPKDYGMLKQVGALDVPPSCTLQQSC